MSLTSKIFLDCRYSKKDGTRPLKLRITINRRSTEIPMGYTISPEFWDEAKMVIKPKCPTIGNVTRLNNILRKKQAEAIETVIRLQDSGELESLSMKDVKAVLTGKSDERMLIAFCNSVIQEMKEAKKVGNARVYRTMRNSIQTFLNDSDIPMSKITFKWLKKYEAWYLGRGNSLNGLSVNMRTLRALLNRAIKQKLLSSDAYPFKEYTIRSNKPRKRAIARTDIDKIIAFVPKTKRQQRAKDYFLMSFYLMGASFIDLAFLKVGDVKNGRIEYTRRKTGNHHSVKITEPLQKILDKYLPGKSHDEFILNVIKSEDLAAQYQNARDELQRYNRSLREIGQLCKIETPLTSYVARHSFATIAKFKDVPIQVISQALGHTNLETTEVYLEEFDNEVLDEYNDMIIR